MIALWGTLGSSPLSRGIPRSSRGGRDRGWIIPALAGNTVEGVGEGVAAGDHPRSRGEYAVPVTDGSVELGSSPLSRGILALVNLLKKAGRIIPALAGNTATAPSPATTRRDHPRSRGEYSVVGMNPLAASGIIPALAGNTLVDKGFYQPDLSDLGNPLLARLRFSKSLAPRLRRPPSWRGGSSGSASEGPGRTIRVSPS